MDLGSVLGKPPESNITLQDLTFQLPKRNETFILAFISQSRKQLRNKRIYILDLAFNMKLLLWNNEHLFAFAKGARSKYDFKPLR